MGTDSFKDYIATTRMHFSYKPVVLLALLNNVDQHGRVDVPALISAFREFYADRQRRGLPVERQQPTRSSPMLEPLETSDEQVWQILARNPLPLMEDFIAFDDDLVRIRPTLWGQMRAADLAELRELALQRIEAYYEGLS